MADSAPMNEVRRRRKRLGVTQEELARLLGVTRQSVYSWERGIRTPPAMLHLALEAIETRKTRTAVMDALYATRKAKEAGDG